LTVDDHAVVDNEQMAVVLFAHFNQQLGTPVPCSVSVQFDHIDLPTLHLSCMDACFTEDEIWAVVRDTPDEKAPGPNGFTCLFYKSALEIVKSDL
jgi:hypothetical protein